MKTLNQINHEFNEIKEEFLFHYLVAITQKCEEMLKESQKETHNHYKLGEIHLSSYLTDTLMYGLELSFQFIQGNHHHTIGFNTKDTYFESNLCKEIICFDEKKVSFNMQSYITYFYENLFQQEQKDSAQMIARHIKKSNSKNYYYDINYPKTWEPISKSILGEKFSIQYEKEKLENEIGNTINSNIKKLKV